MVYKSSLYVIEYSVMTWERLVTFYRGSAVTHITSADKLVVVVSTWQSSHDTGLTVVPHTHRHSFSFLNTSSSQYKEQFN